MTPYRPNFGPFEAAFADDLEMSGPLLLLNLHREERDNIQTIIDRIHQAMRGEDIDRWVADMMGGFDWRPHLVGAVAFLLDHRNRLDRSLIWSAIDRGSWVIPQLVATALFTDPLFAGRVRATLNASCPVRPIPGLPEPTLLALRGKIAASLLATVPEVPDLSASEPIWRADPELVGILEADASWDHSDQIVPIWISRLRERFQERGIHLTPAVGPGQPIGRRPSGS